MADNDITTNENTESSAEAAAETATSADAATPATAGAAQPAAEPAPQAAAPAEAAPGTPAGAPASAPTPAPAAPVPQYAQPQAAAAPAQPAAPANAGSWGWIVLGIFIPLVGLILFLVWRKDKPLSAKASGIGAIIGVVLNIIVAIVTVMALMPAMMTAANMQYTTTTTTTTTAQSDGTTTVVEEEDDEVFDTDDYVQSAGSSILPELGSATFWFEPESGYWVNEDPADGEWYYGYWSTSVDDPNTVEFWGAKDMDDDEGQLVGTISVDQLKANFAAAGWTGDVEVDVL